MFFTIDNMQEYDTLDSSNSGGKTSFDSAGSRHVPEKRSRKLSRPKSLTNLVWDLRGMMVKQNISPRKSPVLDPKHLKSELDLVALPGGGGGGPMQRSSSKPSLLMHHQETTVPGLGGKGGKGMKGGKEGMGHGRKGNSSKMATLYL